MHCVKIFSVLLACLLLLAAAGYSRENSMEENTIRPLRTVVDLRIGQVREAELSNGERLSVELLALTCRRDSLCSAVRSASATVRVDSDTVTLDVANYTLPLEVGRALLDCAVTRDFYSNSIVDWWALEGDARLRLWPAGSPLIAPGTFAYPIEQRWLAGKSQMANEPTHVDGGENPALSEFCYHAPLDFGGCEGLDRVLSAVDGLVVLAGDSLLAGYEDIPFEPGYDNLVIQDSRGWYHRYWHLFSIEPELKPGVRVKKSQPVGLLGKEGCSGGWAHLHYEILSRTSSGAWGNEDGYAYIWQAYLDQFNPPLLAVARPHHLAATGENVELDGSKSWCRGDGKLSYDWTFSDGTTGSGPRQTRTYARPGNYQEVLKVSDPAGHTAYDFVDVEIIDGDKPGELPVSLHAAFHPTLGIAPGDTVVFKVRSFNAVEGSEVWDFGDGSPTVTVKSCESFGWRYERFTSRDMASRELELAPNGYATTSHAFATAGDYLVKVERSGDFGYKATAHLHVRVNGWK